MAVGRRQESKTQLTHPIEKVHVLDTARMVSNYSRSQELIGAPPAEGLGIGKLLNEQG